MVTFLLRVWYASGLYQDDGLWFATAEEILRGKRLYSEVFFDKPPVLPYLYAGLFKLFGAYILTIRLFTICYAVLTSVVLYMFAMRVYDRRMGLIAAALFAVFSTTYISGDMQSLNTDFLMAPLYAAGAYLLIRSSAAPGSKNIRDRSKSLTLAGGCLTGVAFQVNAKAIFNLIFFAALLVTLCAFRFARARQCPVPNDQTPPIGLVRAVASQFSLAAAGFALAALPFLLLIAATDSLSQYKLYVWDLSLSYTSYYPASRIGEAFVRYATDYFSINNTLTVALVGLAVTTIPQAWRCVRSAGTLDRLAAPGRFETDLALLIWFAISFAGVAAGGRFFAHYYFQVLPCLCLIGARGLLILRSSVRARGGILRWVVTSVLAVGFAYTLVRSHSETFGLAARWARGERSQFNRDARIVAAVVRDLPDPIPTVDRVGLGGIRNDGPQSRGVAAPSDYLFVWGNWPEVYYWSGLIPATRYVGVQPLTGLPADIQYGSEEYRPLLDQGSIIAARAELLRDLVASPPKYIVDELGFRDPELSIERFPELREFMSGYKRYASPSKVPIYVRILAYESVCGRACVRPAVPSFL